MVVFILNLYHDGVFVPNPLKYMEGGFKVVNDIQFEDMRIGDLFKVVTRLVLNPPKGLYYCLPGTTLTRGIRPLKTEKDMEAFIKVGFENEFKVELYTKCYDYDVMGYTNNDNLHRIDENIDEPDDVGEEYDEDPEKIDFHVEGEHDVVFEKLTIDDPFLTKLVGKGNFIGSRHDHIPSLSGKYILEENDPNDNLIDVEYKIKKGVRYPSYNPETAWDEFQPILGMKFENPLQLKNALVDYGVKHGYQLWFYKSDNKSLLVYCGRDIELGRCAGRRGMNKKKKAVAEGDKVKGKKVADASDNKPVKWTRMRVLEHKGHHCPFRLWASWMSSERSFQIKSLYSDHRCTRNYNMGSLEYRQAVLDSNPGSTRPIDVDVQDNGQNRFHRFYMCFKGVKDEWLSGCRNVIGIYGCFITHVCKSELLTAMGRDANNQMYLIAWAIVDGLIEAVKIWLPQAEHRHYTHHVYANFKKKWTRLHYKRLFWGAATSTLEQDFTSKMREIRALDEGAYGVRLISKQLQVALLLRMEYQSHSMLKYFLLETVFPSGYQVVEVRKRDEAYGVNLISRECSCRLWNLSGVPCIHVVAAFMHFKLNPYIGVSSWYSQSKWFDTYQFSIKPVYGSKMWQSIINTPPLLPIVKTMSGRPRKNMIKHLSELDDQHHVSRVGRVVTCQKCWRPGHNKSSCTNPRRDKPYETDIPPRPQKSCVNTTSKNKRGGISVNDVFKTQKEVGESSKRVGGTASKRGRGCARGSGTMGSGTASNRGRGCARSFGTMGRGTTRKREKGCARGSRTIGRGSRTMGRGSATNLPKTGPEFNTRLSAVKGPTLSVLEAVDEAIQEHNDGLPSISEGQFHNLNQANGNSEHPVSQHAPTLLETTTEESHTPQAPMERPSHRSCQGVNQKGLPRRGSLTILQMVLARLQTNPSVSKCICDFVSLLLYQNFLWFCLKIDRYVCKT
ncbi:hypothetical protein Tco_0687989 [Tanacetum coccineum]